MVKFERTYRGSGDTPERVVILISKEDKKKIDEWGIPSGMRSRSETIRVLVKRGLEAVENDASSS